MKRTLLSLFILFALVIATPAVATGETSGVDLSGLSLDELVALKDQLNLAIWNSAEWQEVAVPQGIWEVGKDIPAGHWTIRAANGARSTLTWADELNEMKTDSKRFGSTLAFDSIASPTASTFKKNVDKTQTDWILTDGTYLIIKNGDAVFTPYEGKPALNFK